MLVVGVKGEVKLVGLGVQLSDTVGRVSCILETLHFTDVVGTGAGSPLGSVSICWLVGWPAFHKFLKGRKATTEVLAGLWILHFNAAIRAHLLIISVGLSVHDDIVHEPTQPFQPIYEDDIVRYSVSHNLGLICSYIEY